ncbi:MAG: dioxygenase [Herminiimonas sp.]|nr:dioxygenase [Herminiimonas sp.]MDB5851990.1 dioxygenase [Herminiimonas sp.]
MSNTRMPVLFISHGGGPWPWVDGLREQFAVTENALRQLPAQLPAAPTAILVITGHWEERNFTVSTSEHPGMEYDYSGFPPHTYQLRYPAPGSPALAARVQELLRAAGMPVEANPRRGFDHGTFVPLALMYPDAKVPVVLLSLKSGYDPAAHIAVGQAIEPLREEGVLILGSGLTYHNMRGFRRPESMPVSRQFEDYLNDAVTRPDPRERNLQLLHWDQAPAARLAHPREDHLLPLMVVAGAAGNSIGSRLFVDEALDVVMASYRFDDPTASEG